MKKEVKDTIIVELGKKLKEYPHFYLVDVTGMDAEATQAIFVANASRTRLRWLL
jgi:large subunit ribosomal protein L10